MPNTSTEARIALAQYLERIRYTDDLAPTVKTLDALHAAHAAHIPFENLDILLGREIRLDLDSLQQKLVTDRRGGYCFEQNMLFAAVLEDLGFEVTLLSARVRMGATGLRPRTHMLLLVTLPEGRWIADVGFGGEGLLRPVPFEAGVESAQSAWTYRVVREGAAWVLQTRRAEDWVDMYLFTLEPHERVDYEVANHYMSTHPSSAFRKAPTAQRTSPEARYILRHRELTIDTGATTTTRTVSDAELLDVLRETFGLDLPPGTEFTQGTVHKPRNGETETNGS